MNQLTLEWVEAGQVQTQTLTDQQPTKQPGTIRIGRDPAQCDLVLQHPTVSKLHIEIFFDPSEHLFYLRNLRDSNPPLVDQQSITQGVVPLQQGSRLKLGLAELKIKTIALALPPTVVAPASLPNPPALATSSSPVAATHPPTYGLRCPNCQHVSPYDRRGIGCGWCGTSLAAAFTELLLPNA
ncbi:FHA domain-containing protein [Phormidium tenue FACHB-886]|nr:FHA domain-containing protein [Phormidium tenue FACHB-886]